jgi:hypothetical protein
MAATPEPLSRLELAAELRAAGTSWPDTANQMALTHDELRRLVAEYHRDYQRLLRRARTEFQRDALATALGKLRELTRSAEPRIGLMAATTIVRYDLAIQRHGTTPGGDWLRRELRRNHKPTQPRNERAPNTSESTKVQIQQDVTASKNVAQSTPQPAPSPAPQPTPGVTVTPPATAPSAVKPASTASASSPISPQERERRRRLLLNNFAQGRDSATPPGKDDRLTQEISRLVDGWLTQ